MPRRTIADAAAAILEEHRALSAEHLGERIAELELTRAKSPTQAVSRALNADERFRRMGDDRWTVPAQLLNGATLTPRSSTGALRAAVLAQGKLLAGTGSVFSASGN